ncbi:hypothetical protein [Catellatospora tritici]|uniref:hypothetical protein n=1 Tax=Catellatospora tritici TaxID=2851566 RepID=UPI001C2D56B6|nr:hypothetical protein [Catellatospora tritici]MBV1856373.1 hypothetical protein [Catellatospora tritici]
MNAAGSGREHAALRRRETVQATIEHARRHGGDLSVSAIAPAVGVDRSYLYRHADLLHRLQLAQTGTITAHTGPSLSNISLQAELANTRARAKRLHDRVQLLEGRLSELMGEHAWRESGLGAPLDIEALQHANTELQQRNAILVAQLDERDRDLAAARATNRDLMIQMNSVRWSE